MFIFKHMKTPAWSKSNKDIYFLVTNKEGARLAYIGLQDVDLSKGLCNNLCYKTNKKFRGKGISKFYLRDFIEWCPLELDIFRASVRKDNIPSIKMLEFCGFEKVSVKKNVESEKLIGMLRKDIREFETSPILTTTKESRALVAIKRNKLKELEKNSSSKDNNYYIYKLKRFDF